MSGESKRPRRHLPLSVRIGSTRLSGGARPVWCEDRSRAMPSVWLAAAIASVAAVVLSAQQPAAPHTHLVIVVDGLRPDYVTADVMPRLFRLGLRGIVFNAHHAVFPTVTRVNAPSFVTGSYPETHGLMGNAIYIPR